MFSYRSLLVAAIFNLFAFGSAYSEDVTRLGGELTSPSDPAIALELPAPNVRPELVQYHLDGHGDFHGSFEFTFEAGKRLLGPEFNHVSCGGCHVRNGRGAVEFPRRGTGTPMLIKVSLRGLNEDGSPKDIPGIGEQLRDRTASGKRQFNIKLKWQKVRGKYPDGTKYVLRRPSLSFDLPSKFRKKAVHSLRMTPPIIGMGLLEAVPGETIEAMSDPDDKDGDGISGKVNYVLNRESGQKEIGRFGFRASHPNLRQQTGAAFFFDMGLTNEIFSDSSESVLEISPFILDRSVFYLQAAGITPARNQTHPDIIAGKSLFAEIGCSDCHKMTLTTGDSEVTEVANQEFHPFTDLLLHDMGRELADKRAEFSASGREWRTTPLWGIGLTEVLASNKKKIGFLHDGRARTLEEAILWHGGEGDASRRRFKDLSKDDRRKLIEFLRSL
ncbi:MAG: thiol oxidoreductase [Deltaproteobacteria bacterium]|nr:thiol oxidoreductase [Deltaproteobacteria bacterium]